MTERPEQGTGKHPHKDSQEPWPHNERSQSEHRSESRSEHSGGTRQASGSSEGSESRDLKEREYRDEQGNIHHHTHTSQEMKGK
jgi:hypothetical protein